MLDGIPNEIVIVRRRPSWEVEELPHGVWKIAYADFMTALMAFFLVMWLINVTDDSVRRGVAQYFNPVKLASTAPNRKGLNDPSVNGETNENGARLFKGKLSGSSDPVALNANVDDGLAESHKAIDLNEDPQRGGRSTSGRFTQRHPESILFTDPYAVLDTLSEQIRIVATEETNPKGIGSGLEKQDGAQGGEAYRDPFDPLYWQFRPRRGVDGSQIATTGLPSGSTDFDGNQGRSDKKLEKPDQRITAVETDNSGKHTDLSETNNPITVHVTGKAGLKVRDRVSTAPDLSSKQMKDLSKVEVMITQLTEILKDAKGTALEETATQITVRHEGEGALISLTDNQNFGMFAIGSAEPRPELVQLLERLGKTLATAPGQIVIKGHTDARPFNSKTYDNWRLSSARAHMALYMLSRGGVDKNRFERVEGYADRHLKTPDNPLAASNRRVEIYLRGEAL